MTPEKVIRWIMAIIIAVLIFLCYRCEENRLKLLDENRALRARIEELESIRGGD